MSIHDGGSNETPKFWRYCEDDLPPLLISRTNEIVLHFFSDRWETADAISYGGFMLEYNSVSKYHSNKVLTPPETKLESQCQALLRFYMWGIGEN